MTEKKKLSPSATMKVCCTEELAIVFSPFMEFADNKKTENKQNYHLKDQSSVATCHFPLSTLAA